MAELVRRLYQRVDSVPLGRGQESYAYRFDSCPDYKLKHMKNENLKEIVRLVLAIVLVVVMGYILKLINNI